MSVSIFNDLFGQFNVILERLGGSVDHNGSKAAVDAGLAGLKVGTVVKVKNDRDLGAFDNRSFNELHKIGVICVCTRALGNLKNNRSFLLLAGFGDTLHDLHVVDIESADGITAVIGFFEHFC